MDSATLPRSNNKRATYPAPGEDPEVSQDSKRSPPKKLRSMESETLNSNVSTKEHPEIPSLDDMTNYLFSNEIIEKDNYIPHPSHQTTSQSFEIPEMDRGNNDYEESQTLSTRTREKSDSSLLNGGTSASGLGSEIKKEIELLYKMAHNYSANGEYQQAINYYNRINTLNEKSGPAWIAKGHCYSMLGQDTKALTTYQQALEVSPICQKDEQLWYAMGLLYQKGEAWASADRAFRTALRLEPKPTLRAEILYSLGMVLKSMGEYPESIKMLTSSVLTEVFPPERIVDILCQNGHTQEKMNDLEGALKTYQYALMIQENNPKSLLCAGWISFQMDKIEQALNYLTRAETLLPNNSDITYVIARCHLKLKQHTTAYDCLHKCLTVQRYNAVYWGSLGILFAELMQLKQAYETLSNALKFNPSCPENFFNLGCLFELSNQPQDAITMYDKAIGLQNNFSLAINRRKRLLTDIKNDALEVQFKHPPFILQTSKDTKPEKTPQLGILPKTTGIMEELVDHDHQARKLKEQKIKVKTLKETKEELSSLKGSTTKDQTLTLKPVRLDLLASKLEPQKSQSESIKISSSKSQNGLLLGQDVSSLTLSRTQITSEPTGTKLPGVKSLNTSIGGLNNFSILQNNFNNVNNFVINPVMSYGSGTGQQQLFNSSNSGSKADNYLSSITANRSKTEDSSLTKNSASKDLAKQLSGLQVLLAKNNGSAGAQASGDSLKAVKNISSPIVLKHNPLVLTTPSNEGNKGSESKLEVKILHRMSKSDGDDEEVVQKKVKVQQNGTKGETVPQEEK